MSNVIFFRPVRAAWLREVQFTGDGDPHRYSIEGGDVVGWIPKTRRLLFVLANDTDGWGEWTPDVYGGREYPLREVAKPSGWEITFRAEAAAHWEAHRAARIAQAEPAAKAAMPAPTKRRFRFLDFLRHRQ